MKKIKSKLLYVNTQLQQQRNPNQNDRSPSPDFHHRSRIPTTHSPEKQISNYFTIKSSINPFFIDNNQVNHNQTKKISKFSLNFNVDSIIDMQKQIEKVKIKTPTASARKEGYQFQAGYSTQFKANNHQTKSRQQNNTSSLMLENTAKINRVKVNKITNNNEKDNQQQFKLTPSKNDKSSYIYTYSTPTSYKNQGYLTPQNKSAYYDNRENDGYGLRSNVNKNDSEQYSSKVDLKQVQRNNTVHISSNVNSIELTKKPDPFFLSNFSKKNIIFKPAQQSSQSFELISIKQENRILKQKLIQKQKQIQKFEQYFLQYENIGESNEKLQKKMSKILDQLNDLKEKQSNYQSQKENTEFFTQISNQRSTNQYQSKNQQDYIKIYDNYDEDDNGQSQFNYSNQLKQQSVDPAELNLQNNFTKANSNQKSNQALMTPTYQQNGFKFKPNLNISLDNSTTYTSDHNTSKKDNILKISKKNYITQQVQLNNNDQGTTVKKQTQFIVKKKKQSTQNFNNVIESNLMLSQSINRLSLINESLLNEIQKQSQKSLKLSYKMQKWEEQLVSIKLNIAEISKLSHNQIQLKNHKQISLKSGLKEIQDKVSKLFKSIDENAKEYKQQNHRKKVFLQQSRSSSALQSSRINIDMKDQTSDDKNRVTQIKSPTFSYIDEPVDINNEDSFQLSTSAYKESRKILLSKNSSFNIDVLSVDQKKQNSQNRQERLSQESQLVSGSSSNATSQFPKLKDQNSNGRNKSQCSEIRINFDDLNDEELEHYKKCELLHVQTMKGSFGPINLSKEMSKSERGQFITQQDHQEARPTRPRENSSINIFFSNDSISHTQLFSKKQQNRTSKLKNSQIKQENQIRSSNQICQKCGNNLIKSHSDLQNEARLNMQAVQMRAMISQLSEERDKLKKIIKSKVSIIDQLQISLKQLQSYTSINEIKSRPNLFDKEQQNQMISLNQFHHVDMRKDIHRSKKQIQDIIGEQNRNDKNLPPIKLEKMRIIQEEIRKQLELRNSLDKQKSLLKQGTFGQLSSLREQSFSKTKAILLRLIYLMRQFVDGNEVV